MEGLWEKKTAGATSLVQKSPYDPVEQAKNLVEKKTNAWKNITATINLTLNNDDLEFSTLTFTGAMTGRYYCYFPEDCRELACTSKKLQAISLSLFKSSR